MHKLTWNAMHLPMVDVYGLHKLGHQLFSLLELV